MRLWTVQPRTTIDEALQHRWVAEPWLPKTASFHSPNSLVALTWMAYEMYRRGISPGVEGMFWFYVSTIEQVVESRNRSRIEGAALLSAPECLTDAPGTTCLVTLDVPENECLVSAVDLWEIAMVKAAIARDLEEDERLSSDDPPRFETLCETWQRMFDRTFTANGYYGPPEQWIWQATTNKIKREWILDVELL